MSRLILLLFTLVSLCCGAPSLAIFPAVGPSLASPSFYGFSQNALQALQEDLPTLGGPGPTQYNRLAGSLNPLSLIDSAFAFNSWLGIVNPAPPFDQEFGNQLYFGIQVVGGDGSDLFSLDQLIFFNYFFSSGEPRIPSQLFGPAFASYNGLVSIGVQYGDDGRLGGGDDRVLNSGEPGDTPVNALYTFWPFGTCACLGDPSLSPEESIQLTALAVYIEASLWPTDPYIEACLSSQPWEKEPACDLAGPVRSVTPLSERVPEPASFALLGVGLAAIACARRRLR